jgi:putative membrane protein
MRRPRRQAFRGSLLRGAVPRQGRASPVRWHAEGRPMLWLKAFHVVAVVAWFAGLFYLPRLYVYHADAKDSISIRRFDIMERRLFAIMTIGAVAAVALGVAMLAAAPAYLAMGWLRVKLVLVLVLIAYHVFCYKLMRDFAQNRNTHSAKWYRGFNEVPSLLLIAIVLLAVVKPF